MTWTVTWSPGCDIDILHMPYRTAERVCMAVVAFATDGSGHVALDAPDSDHGRISTRGGFALVQFVESERRIIVLRIRSTAPPRLR